MPPLAAIFLWPFVMMVLFKRFPLPVALCWSIFAGYLFLPTTVGLNLPALPTINKHSMPSIAAVLILTVIAARLRVGKGTQSQDGMPFILPGWLPRHPVTLTLVLGMIVGAFMTAITNGDRLQYGPRVISGLGIYDSFAAALTIITVLLPLFLGRKFLATASSHKTLLFVFCIAGLIYSIPTLYEVRMSPQLNRIVYGFFPHSWSQHIRGSGFRPLVFLQHGLWLGIFMSGAVLAVLGYIRMAKPERKGLYWGIFLWLFATLVLAKSLGALLIALVLAPVMLFFPIRLQLIVAAVIAGTVLFYPALRGAGFIPTERLVSLAADIDYGRSKSLQYRLNNEDILLEKANQRPLFGWGGRARARVFNNRGEDISTTDGRWIISIGNEGWLGYLGRFGLLTLPIILLTLRKRKYEVTLPTSALCLVLAGNLVDLIPNAGLTPITWLMAGALMGRLEIQNADQQESEISARSGFEGRGPGYNRAPVHSRHREPDITEGDAPRYTRFAPVKHTSNNTQDS